MYRRAANGRKRISYKGQNAKPKGRKPGNDGTGGADNAEHFAGANKNAKLVCSVANLFRRARLDYEAFRHSVQT
jgi:hypothetical protein